jgi:predicted HicB family RNase H-like nuclease
MKREVNYKMKPSKRFWSKRPMVHTTFRIPEDERELWRAASMKAGVSLNDFVREAIKEKSTSLLVAEHGNGNATVIEA